jgi:hypothetical protein
VSVVECTFVVLREKTEAVRTVRARDGIVRNAFRPITIQLPATLQDLHVQTRAREEVNGNDRDRAEKPIIRTSLGSLYH